MDWVGVRGSLAEPGLATVWARARVALVEGAEMSPWQRLLVTADSASGVASWLDPAEWWFINTELTVHAHREPEGDWIGLDAATDIGPTGIGTARAALHDRTGLVGRSTQTLVVRPR